MQRASARRGPIGGEITYLTRVAYPVFEVSALAIEGNEVTAYLSQDRVFGPFSYESAEKAREAFEEMVAQIDVWDAATREPGEPSEYFRFSTGTIVLLDDIDCCCAEADGVQVMVMKRDETPLLTVALHSEPAAETEAEALNDQMALRFGDLQKGAA